MLGVLDIQVSDRHPDNGQRHLAEETVVIAIQVERVVGERAQVDLVFTAFQEKIQLRRVIFGPAGFQVFPACLFQLLFESAVGQ